ncbi:dihydroorotate dehydrogenase [Candidatus Woesearchaeota archaeon]|nr:dihydroorotate dehydrogenase [Candidatus Woesearchaeota archaeon]
MINSKIFDINFNNPLVLASGILGVHAEYFKTLEKNNVGGITTKSISLDPRKGHKNPIMFNDNHGFMNAVGLSNAGIDKSIEMIKHAKQIVKTPIIASIFGGNVEEFGELAKLISEAKPDIIEANISCPNVKKEFKLFGANAEDAAAITNVVKNNTKIPVVIKLTPNVTDIKPIAKSVEQAGADGITAINTLAGMRIDINAKMPILTNKFGGLSGKGIFPVAIKNVYEIYKTVNIPIIGTGGITTGKDAIEMLMAGASLLGVGTAVYYEGVKVFTKINLEIEEWMTNNGYSNIKEIIGVAHE